MKIWMTVLLLVCFGAHANDWRQSMHKLQTFTSFPEETLDAFVLRMAPYASQTTRELGSEVCGHFQQAADGRYRIALHTNFKPLDCFILVEETPLWAATRLTFHTHTQMGGLVFSTGDKEAGINGYLVVGSLVKKKIGPQVTRVRK